MTRSPYLIMHHPKKCFNYLPILSVASTYDLPGVFSIPEPNSCTSATATVNPRANYLTHRDQDRRISHCHDERVEFQLDVAGAVIDVMIRPRPQE